MAKLRIRPSPGSLSRIERIDARRSSHAVKTRAMNPDSLGTALMSPPLRQPPRLSAENLSSA
jgi:hypothetical protein